MSSRTSSGSKRPNRLDQMMATSAGATSNCGKRASAAWTSSPPSTACCSRVAHERQHARNHLAVVELGQLWKPRPFSDDEPDHVLPRRAEDLVDEGIDDELGQSADWELARGRRGDRADEGAQLRPHELLEQVLLVAEVEIDRALGDAGVPGHVVEPGVGKTARRELRERRIENGRPPLRRLLGARRAALAHAARGPARLGPAPPCSAEARHGRCLMGAN